MAKYLCIWVRTYRFSVTSFSKWLPGGHIRFFGFWMAWFRQRNSVCFGISVSNFICMSFVAVGRSLTIVSYVAFKMAALWFCTMFNCNPPIAHCHPLLWGGGILVDHWSTISSFNLCPQYLKCICFLYSEVKITMDSPTFVFQRKVSVILNAVWNNIQRSTDRKQRVCFKAPSKGWSFEYEMFIMAPRAAFINKD